MQKYILFIWSMVLCSSLSAQLIKEVASLTRSLGNLQKLIAESSGPSSSTVPLLDAATRKGIFDLVLRDIIKSGGDLKDYLEAYGTKLTIEQAEILYTEAEEYVKTASLKYFLPDDTLNTVLNKIIAKEIKSPEEAQKSFEGLGYFVTLKQAQEFYEAIIPPIPDEPPPGLPGEEPVKPVKPVKPPPTKITAAEAIVIIEKAFPDELVESTQVFDYLQKGNYSLPYAEAKKIAAEINKKPGKKKPVKKPTTGGQPEVKPKDEPEPEPTGTGEIGAAYAAVKKAMGPPDNKVFTSTKEITNYLKGVTKYPGGLSGPEETVFIRTLKYYIKKSE